MHWLVNLPVVIWRRLKLLLQGLGALGWVIVSSLAALFGRDGTVAGRVIARLASPKGQRAAFAVLRLLQPNLRLPIRTIKSYSSNGKTVVASRRADVIDILLRDRDFEVVYGPRMDVLTDGENFFLGMQDGPRYARDTTNMRMAMRRDDVENCVLPCVRPAALKIVSRLPGRIDVPTALTQSVAYTLLDKYFGTPGPSQAKMVEWTTQLFAFLFLDLQADPEVFERSKVAAKEMRHWLDGHIADRRAAPARDDVLGRCLVLSDAQMPGMTDKDIRNNLMGLLIGELPTLAASAILALDELLNRPEILAQARDAAVNGDDARLAAYIFEALRFRPLNPVVYRRAAHDTAIGQGSLRRRKVKKDTIVMASNLSAMFDPLVIPDATRFRIDRPWETYMLWGYGLHACFGGHINRAVLPAMLKPLLAKPNLRRAEGAAGQIDTAGTPFPQHLHLRFDD